MTTDQYSSLIDFLGGKFDAIDQRFDAIDQRFEGIDQRFEGVDQRFEGIDQRFEGIDQRLDGIDQGLGQARLERAAHLEEARRHATVLFEQSQANLRVVSEGLILRLESIERRLHLLEVA